MVVLTCGVHLPPTNGGWFVSIIAAAAGKLNARCSAQDMAVARCFHFEFALPKLGAVKENGPQTSGDRCP